MCVLVNPIGIVRLQLVSYTSTILVVVKAFIITIEYTWKLGLIASLNCYIATIWPGWTIQRTQVLKCLQLNYTEDSNNAPIITQYPRRVLNGTF